MQATYIKFILVVIFSFNFIFSQGSYNLSSDKSFGSIENNENITIFKDNVIATNQNAILYANKAISYHESNKIILSGDVKMYNFSDTLLCDQLIIINNKNDKYQAEGNVTFIENNHTIGCKHIVYWPNTTNIRAVLTDEIEMKSESDILNCDQLIIYEILDNEREYEANGNINYYQEDRHIKSEKLIYWANPKNINLINNGIISDSLRVIKGDSINCFFKNDNLEKMDIYSNSFVINQRQAKDDSTSLLYPVYDTLRGENIFISFINNSKVKNLYMHGMARAQINIIDNEVLNGINAISGDTINIIFIDNKINKINISGGAQGEYTPLGIQAKTDTIISYNAELIEYDLDNKISYLINNAEVIYGDNTLNGGAIDANWGDNILEAKSYNDILPQLITPTNENPMYGSYMVFDLSTDQGKIYDGYSEMELGIFKGKTNSEIFRGDDENVHIKNGLFTSCSLDEPHYYFYSDYMKMIPNDKIIAKPMILYINEFSALYLPFAILPNSNNARRSGWIMPSFGHRSSTGTYIDDLGYYWAPNDYMDLRTMIDFEDKRGLYAQSTFRYNKNSGNSWYNYKMQGSLYYEKKIYLLDDIEDFTYMFNQDSTREITNISFQHNQTFDPTQSLTINYNFKSERDTNEVDLNKRLDQTLSSTFNYVKRWDKSNFNLSFYQFEDLYIAPPDSLNQQQFVKYSNGPTLSYNINSRKLFGDGDKWFNKIYMSYNFEFNHGRNDYYKNSYELNDTTLIWDSTDSIMSYSGGVENKIKFSMSNKFGWLTVIPSLTINEDWLLRNKSSLVPEIEERRTMWSINLNFNTKINGIIPFKIGLLESIRHKVTPEVSISYQPNFINNDGIDLFENSFLPITSSGYTRSTFKLNNLFQIKIKNENGEYIKRDIMTWDMVVSYNPNNKDNGLNNLSNLSSFISFKKPNGGEYLRVGMQHSFYDKEGELINFQDGSLPRLTYFNIQASTKFNIFGSEFMHSNEIISNLDNEESNTDSLLSITSYTPSLNTSKKWETDFYLNFSGGYTEQVDKWNLDNFNLEARTTVKLTKNWLLTHAALFNLVDMKIQSQSLKFYRPLHCWDFTFTWWPSGYNKGFRLAIYINHPDLQDIKVTSSSSNRKFGN